MIIYKGKIMKRSILIIVLLFTTVIANAQLRQVKNEAFQRGEFLTYKAYYDAILTGEVIAGNCTFEVTPENKVINDRSTYHIQVIGKTKGAFNFFFKVIDRYETFVDEQALVPWLFIRRVNEGGYIINQDITFNQNKKVAYFKDLKNGRTANVTTPANIQDLVSAIYYCRSIDLSTYNASQDFAVKFMLDDTVYSTKVIFLGKETINTAIGKVRCIKIKPQVLTGTVFKDPYPVVLWVSDDKNKVPIKAESEILVGKVKLELIGYTGLRNSFTALVK
jgi:hypothetical protein